MNNKKRVQVWGVSGTGTYDIAPGFDFSRDEFGENRIAFELETMERIHDACHDGLFSSCAGCREMLSAEAELALEAMNF